jgi:DNA-binding GntR family transcriptional regulator
MREAYLVRAELEGLAVELATPRFTDEDLFQLRAAEQRFRSAMRELAASDSADSAVAAEWSGANDAFHEVIQRAAGNERLRKTILDLHRLFPRGLTWSALGSEVELLSENADQHRQIREAIERREPATARLLMTYHVHRAGELVADWFERQARARL